MKKTALERIHEAYAASDLETAKKKHEKINKEERLTKRNK